MIENGNVKTVIKPKIDKNHPKPAPRPASLPASSNGTSSFLEKNRSFLAAYAVGVVVCGSLLALVGLVAYFSVHYNSPIPFAIFMFGCLTPIIAMAGGWKP